LVLLTEKFADYVPEMYAGLRKHHASPLAAVRAYAEGVACIAETPEMLAHHLDYLRLDLTDPDMHVQFRRQADDIERLTRQVETTITGSLFTWATYREGTAAGWVRRDLELVLGP
jgi:hypothetical protein